MLSCHVLSVVDAAVLSNRVWSVVRAVKMVPLVMDAVNKGTVSGGCCQKGVVLDGCCKKLCGFWWMMLCRLWLVSNVILCIVVCCVIVLGGTRRREQDLKEENEKTHSS